MEINSLERVVVNDSLQWLLVRGKSDKPLIIHVQAGPGIPIIPEAHTMQKQLHLENDYLVAYWDQRACGKSYSKETDPQTINFSQLRDDIIICTKYLLGKYKKEKAILVGYSIGATLSLMAASKNKQIFERLFLVGIDIDVPAANKFAIEFAMSKAREKNKTGLLKQAVALSKTPINNTRLFQKRAKLLTDLGGIKANSSYNKLMMTSVSNMIFSKAYRLADISKTAKGMEFCQSALLSELNELDLFKTIRSTDVPVHFIQGKLDAIAPYEIAVSYYKYLDAKNKSFDSFEHSAHLPHYDEPEKFAKILRNRINRPDQTKAGGSPIDQSLL
jgi:pimeloyl-ACP methyl ester carboxylesterase